MKDELLNMYQGGGGKNSYREESQAISLGRRPAQSKSRVGVAQQSGRLDTILNKSKSQTTNADTS